MVDLQYDENSLNFTAGYVCLCGVCSHVIVFGLSVSWLGTQCGCGGCCGCDTYTVVCVACVYAECVRVTAMLVWGMDGVVVMSEE